VEAEDMPTALDFFERYHRAVFCFLRRMEGAGGDAEDLTQEVFLRVLRALDTYEERQLERAWVFRIARNVWLDHTRSRQRAGRLQPVDEPPVVRLAAAQGTQVALDHALARLQETDREAFLMREVAGLGYAEIAETLELTPDAVRNRIHRAWLALRECLEAPRAISRTAGRMER
jgi:RNA polymerase sigma-70 factor (ECF subfamily)